MDGLPDGWRRYLSALDGVPGFTHVNECKDSNHFTLLVFQDLLLDIGIGHIHWAVDAKDGL